MSSNKLLHDIKLLLSKNFDPENELWKIEVKYQDTSQSLRRVSLMQ